MSIKAVMVLPPASEAKISVDLCDLTECIAATGIEPAAGFLGGEFGYGAHYENKVFRMHPFCWCERMDCRWCLSCECPDGAWRHFLADGTEVDGEAFYKAGGYSTGTAVEVPERQCAGCKTLADVGRAPNFEHFATGTKVSWYKYIGRSMEANIQGDWRAIIAECLKSIEGSGASELQSPPPSVNSALSVGVVDHG